MATSSGSTRPRPRARRRGGPWPGWLRWWYGQGGPARDAAIMDRWLAHLEAGNYRPDQLVAQELGVSRSTVHRALIRYGQRVRGVWPPEIPNGFGYGAERWRQERRQALDLANYQVPIPDNDEPDGEGWDAWTG